VKFGVKDLLVIVILNLTPAGAAGVCC